MHSQRHLGFTDIAWWSVRGSEAFSYSHKHSSSCMDEQQVEDMDVDEPYTNYETVPEIKEGIPETGAGTGTSPFNLDGSSLSFWDPRQPDEDMEWDDIDSFSNTGILETREGTGTCPFSSDGSSLITRQPKEGKVSSSCSDVVSYLHFYLRKDPSTDILPAENLQLLAKRLREEPDGFHRDSLERNRRLLELIKNPFPYIKAGGPSQISPYSNTCVPDSMIAALHTTSIKSSEAEDCFNKNNFFKEVMSLLNKKFNIKARNKFVEELNTDKLDLHGNVSDYFPLLHKLVNSNQKPPYHNPIFNAKHSNGVEIIILGEWSDPALILFHNNQAKRTLNKLAKDFILVNKRYFLLQFLLIGRNGHMTMCFHSSGNNWHLYDNDPAQPSFVDFALESISPGKYVICLAGYIPTPGVKEYNPRTPMTGEDAGAWPFYSDTSSYVEMEDLYSCSVAVPESGEAPLTSEIVYC